MQALTSEVWRLRSPLVEYHPGGLAWSTYHAAEPEHEPRRQVWEQDGDCVAWGVEESSSLAFLVHPEHRELLDQVLDWGSAETAASLASDVDAIAALERQGYRRSPPESPYFVHMGHDLDDLPDPTAPTGFRLRTIHGVEDLERRVAVHRAAWHPSRVTAESYRRVMLAFPYRRELDCVVEAPDGSFAASALFWLDAETGVAELEPVGTDPRFARRGLAAAICLFGLHRLREHGAESAIVHARGDPAYPAPKRLYESIGFREYARSIPFQKARASIVET
jgi:ribosomal protein S18 acetylase RimI-like enzyme